jgi:transcriptional regulator with XRE-family HTH domain
MLLKDRKLLARLMAIQGWSARTLATESGFRSHTYVLRLLRGDARSCTAERAVAIAANLQVPLDSLFMANVSTSAGQVVQQGKPFRRSGAAEREPAAGAHPPRSGSRARRGSATAIAPEEVA